MAEITSDIQTDTQKEARTNSQTDIQSTSIYYKVGFAQDRNKKYRRTMEDAHSYFTNFNNSSEQAWFAVYDGHAGKSAAIYCGEQVHTTFITSLQHHTDVLEAFNHTFVQTDIQIAEKKSIFSGCCAVCCYLRIEKRKSNDDESTLHYVCYSANAGDARAVLSRNGKAKRLTYDHKGSDDHEAKRISEAGGFVLKNRVNGVLAVTRSLGDMSLKEWVIGNPFTSEVVLEECDEYLVIACDGVWDVMTDQEVIDLVNGKDVQQAADEILEKSLEKMSTDNLSVIVVKFQPLEKRAK